MLSCDCDFDGPEFLAQDDRTCRKACKCSECRRVITPGERYTYIRGKWDGDFAVYRTCQHCEAATEYINLVSTCQWCYYFSMRWFPPDSDEEFDGEPTAVRRLVVSARRKWTRKRGPRKGEMYPIPWVPKLTA
jgi:hypothetical protein